MPSKPQHTSALNTYTIALICSCEKAGPNVTISIPGNPREICLLTCSCFIWRLNKDFCELVVCFSLVVFFSISFVSYVVVEAREAHRSPFMRLGPQTCVGHGRGECAWGSCLTRKLESDNFLPRRLEKARFLPEWEGSTVSPSILSVWMQANAVAPA